jgi:hypothetical protein
MLATAMATSLMAGLLGSVFVGSLVRPREQPDLIHGRHDFAASSHEATCGNRQGRNAGKDEHTDKRSQARFFGSGRLHGVIRVIQKIGPGPYLGREGPD